MKRRLFSLFTLALIVMGFGVLGAKAQTAGGLVIPKAVGAPHPEGNAFWRINHMDLLSHDRDQSLRLGNREIEASLKECVACHAVDDENGEPVGYDSPEHTCRTCHDYAAVKVDCFSCHQSKPDADVLSQLLSEAPVNVSMVEATLDMENYLLSLQLSDAQTAEEMAQ